VSRLIVEALPHTLELAALALMIAILVGITAGVLSAAWRGTWLDRSSIFVSLLGVSMPDFWMAILVVLVFAVKLQWFPAFGVGGMTFLVLPAAARRPRAPAALAPLTRSSLPAVLQTQY